MAYRNTFEQLLTGGHPNSLGNTLQVVDLVLHDRKLLDDLYQCYSSDDEVVCLRVSNAIKRICKEHPDWLVPFIDKLLREVAAIDQASAQWTLAQLFLQLEQYMDKRQKQEAQQILKTNLGSSNDWIVQNMTLETLGHWAKNDDNLRRWLIPRLQDFSRSGRKSVVGRASKISVRLGRPDNK